MGHFQCKIDEFTVSSMQMDQIDRLDLNLIFNKAFFSINLFDS